MPAFAGVLLSVTGGLIINQFHQLRAYLDARFETGNVRFASVDARFDSVDVRFASVDARFDAVDRRLDNLDRDVRALAAALFRRE